MLENVAAQDAKLSYCTEVRNLQEAMQYSGTSCNSSDSHLQLYCIQHRRNHEEESEISYVVNRWVIGGHRRRENLGELVVDGRNFVLHE